MLKTIAEHAEDVRKRMSNKYASGIECPNCLSELQFVDDAIYMSYPPQRDVKCFSCEYKNKVIC